MFHHFDLTKTIPSGQGILDVTLKVVRLIGHTSDATLGPVGIGIRTSLLGHNGDGMASLRQIECKAQPADTTSDNDCLIMGGH